MRRITATAVVTLIGLVLVGAAAGAVAGLNARQKAYTIQVLQAHWRAPFDLLVLPYGTKNTVGALADPNAIDEGPGGISLAQWHRIEALPGVAVAAPLVPLGIEGLSMPGLGALPIPGGPGIFRMTTSTSNSGLPDATGPGEEMYVTNTTSMHPAWSPQVFGLVVAIDPVQEAKLVGLDKAIVKGTFLPSAATDKVSTYSYQEVSASGTVTKTAPLLTDVPVIYVDRSPAAGNQDISVARLKLPFSLHVALRYFASFLPYALENAPFSGLSGTDVFTASIPARTFWKVWTAMQFAGNGAGPMALGPFQVAPGGPANQLTTFFHPGAVTYKRVRSPFPSRWPIALRAAASPCTGLCPGYLALQGEPFRSITVGQTVAFTWAPVGLFDPSRIHEAKDPLTHLPLVMYRMEEGSLVLTPAGTAINPPGKVLPGESPLGLFSQAPTAITAIKDVAPILGPTPVSSIRVRVSGVGTFTAASRAKLASVAEAIRRATGLQVEVVRGASPQEVLVHPASAKGYTRVGWIQEDWVRLGASTEILTQTLLSQDVILIPVLFGALVFALTAGIISVEAKRREYATLLSLGVKPQTVFGRIMGEGAAYGGVVFVLALSAAVLFGGAAALQIGLVVSALAALVMTLALVPVALAASRMDPLKALKEDTPPLARVILPISVVGMGLSLFFSSLRRHLAAFVALVVPGGLFYMIFLVEGAVNHSFFVTALGHYILVHVSPLMQLGAVVAVLLATLAAAQIGMRNAVLRSRTWAIGQAVGWPLRVAAEAGLIEAGIVGITAGAAGATAAALVGDPLFGMTFLPGVWAEAIGVIVLASLVAAGPSTFIVARQQPVTHLRGAGA